MDNGKIQSATKSIFLECLNDPDILEIIKDKINSTLVNDNCEDYCNEQLSLYPKENDNSIYSRLSEKIEAILLSQQRIEEIMNSKIAKDLQREEQIKEYQDQNNKLMDENIRLKNANDNFKSEKREIEEKCKCEISKYVIFEELFEIWNCINALGFDKKKYIENLCGGSDLLAILSLGRDENRIEQLWSYLRDLAIKADTEKGEIIKLNKYFEFCLKVANSIRKDKEKYIITGIELDSEFDINTSIRTSDSKQIGKIKEVVVNSVIVGKNIKYKAIVRVE